MPNRFVGTWGSNLKPKGRGSRLAGLLHMRDSDDTHVGVRFRNLRGRLGPEVIATTTNGVPPTITFSRPDNGETITYEGSLIIERRLGSKTTGTFKRKRALLVTEEGDWTANRPPPPPREDGRTRDAKKATTGKKASAKKAAKSQKPVSKKKGPAAKKSARLGKAGKKA